MNCSQLQTGSFARGCALHCAPVQLCTALCRNYLLSRVQQGSRADQCVSAQCSSQCSGCSQGGARGAGDATTFLGSGALLLFLILLFLLPCLLQLVMFICFTPQVPSLLLFSNLSYYFTSHTPQVICILLLQGKTKTA